MEERVFDPYVLCVVNQNHKGTKGTEEPGFLEKRPLISLWLKFLCVLRDALLQKTTGFKKIGLFRDGQIKKQEKIPCPLFEN